MGICTDKMVRDKDKKDKVVRYRGAFKWKGIKVEPYKKSPGGWTQIVRNVLIGNEGDSSSMHLRYFEISKGGCSSLEYHNHEHIVVCLRGKGKIKLSDRVVTVKPYDAVYIAPKTVHQQSNSEDEPFGFFCIVKAKRDKPVLVRQKIY